MAKKGRKQLALHKELLASVSKFVTDVVYDAELETEDAQRVIAKVRALSASLPEVEFRHDKENRRIILRLTGEVDYE